MEKFRLLTRNLILGKKYLIIDEIEEVKSEIADKEREDFLEDEEVSDKDRDFLKENCCNSIYQTKNKENYWESSDEDNFYNYSDYDDISISNFSTNNEISKLIKGEKIINETVLLNNKILQNPKSILKSTSIKIMDHTHNLNKEMPVSMKKKVNFSLMNNTLNGSFLI